jgi:hypothetical protein
MTSRGRATAARFWLLAAASLLVAAASAQSDRPRRVHALATGEPVAVRRLHVPRRGDGAARPVLLAAQVRGTVEAAVPLRRARRRPDQRAQPPCCVQRPDSQRERVQRFRARGLDAGDALPWHHTVRSSRGRRCWAKYSCKHAIVKTLFEKIRSIIRLSKNYALLGPSNRP